MSSKSGSVTQNYQDWEPVVIKKRKPTGPRDQQVQKARQQGQTVEVQKKYNAGTNKQKQAPTSKKAEDDTESLEVETVGLSTGQKIQQARQAKGWTQKELAMAISEKQQVVQQYEQGKALPNGQVLSKMERVLGAKLRGK